MRVAIVAMAALALGGCASTIEGELDERAVEQCEEETSPGARLDCYDRADDARWRRGRD